MAAYFMLGFLFLLSCFMLLVLAAVDEECGKPQHCGYLGEISFPFTTSPSQECSGLLLIQGCQDDSADKEIQLTDRNWYKIDSIFRTHNFDLEYLSIFIHYPDFDAVFAPEPPKKPFKISRNITFSKCIRNSNDPTHTMSLYRNCPYYDIYFNSSSEHDDPDSPLPMPILPFACLLVSFLPLGQVTIPTCPSYTFVFSLLEIKLDIPEDCKSCSSHEDCKPCSLPRCFNFDGQNLTCIHDDEQKLNPGPANPQKPAGPNSEKQNSKAMKIGLSVGIPSAVAVVALVVILLLYKGRNKYSGLQNQSRSAYSASFRESGAVYFGIPVFSYEELQEATNNFDQARELGEGGFGTVYYGKLRDGREVAVKRLFERNYRPVESFINEIQILTRLRHRNLVSLYGCTSRHSRELLLVYEYIPNGTVSSHLHGDQTKPCLLPWLVRMKIAIDTASALAYLHASDIIHRDVKTSNILLDNDFGVKVADFGLSRLYPDDATHVSTAPRGTPGYVDPDYRLCYQLTTKSDVYSFGVVLVELISSLKAVDMNRSRDDIKLANLAIRRFRRGQFVSWLILAFISSQMRN
ncbi:serine/threonine-protein kinase [Spatholobus suberectus]|nr:serine/threonine-protein kinase [Spatholobus suberectus]